MPPVSETGALLLDSTDLIRFVPNAHFIGTLSDAFDFNAWNASIGTAGQTADITSDPLASAVSDDSSYATIYVQPVVNVSVSGSSVTVSTDAPVPNDLFVTVSTDIAGVSQTASGVFDYYLTSSSQYWSQSGPTGFDNFSDSVQISVDIPAGQNQATININAAPASIAGSVNAWIVPEDGQDVGSVLGSSLEMHVDSYAVATANQLPVNVAASDIRPGVDGAATASSGSFDGQSPDGVDANNFILTENTDLDSGEWTTIHWYTADGSAAAGTDYTASSGTFYPSPGGSDVSVSIPIFHHVNAGDKTFYIVFDLSGGAGAEVEAMSVEFANPVLAMYGNTNGNGQFTLNDDDPPSDPNYTTENPPVIPVTAASSGNSPDISSVSGNLIPIQTDAVGAPGDTLELSQTSGSGASQIYLDAAGTQLAPASFTYGNFPSVVYLEGTEAGTSTLTDELLAPNGAEIGENELALAETPINIGLLVADVSQGMAASQATDVWVGQRITVGVFIDQQFVDANTPGLGGVTWSKPQGQTVGALPSGAPAATPGTAPTGFNGNVNAPGMVWYWTSGGTYTETVVVRYKGSVTTLTTKFNVQVPNVTAVANPTFPATQINPFAGGNYTLDAPGINVVAKQVDNSPGSLVFVQTLNWSSSRTGNNVPPITANVPNALDNTYPYPSKPAAGGGFQTIDVPGRGVATGYTLVNINVQYAMYVMYNPNPNYATDPNNPNYLSVPILVYNWQWVVTLGRATGTGQLAIQGIEGSTTKGPMTSKSAIGVFPTWTNVFTNVP